MNTLLKSTTQFVQKRFLNIYESHSKMLFTQYEIAHGRGYPVKSVDEAVEMAKLIQDNFDSEKIVIKAEVLAGGRGKGTFDTGYQGGVQLCNDLIEVEDVAKNMLGNRLQTVQTGAPGILVKQLYICECLEFDRELYFAILLDRESGGPVMIASTEGGVEIETIAKEMPEKILKLSVDARIGPTDEELSEMAYGLEFVEDKDVEAFKDVASKMYNLMVDKDLLLVEINPLVHGESGVLCLDAKVGVDDNALFRQPEITEKSDISELDEKEIEAKKFDLQYIALDGNIGCLVNGAGLAMATMDIIKLHGGDPANFLDVGGDASTEQVREAFKIITSDDNVKGILVNIFGGIMKCDVIAQGIIEACNQIDLQIPLVVRLSGTNSERGKELLDGSGLPILSALDLEEAAAIAVKMIS